MLILVVTDRDVVVIAVEGGAGSPAAPQIQLAHR
jgi:hypothetical protein